MWLGFSFNLKPENENKMIKYSFRVSVYSNFVFTLHWGPIYHVYIDLKDFNIMSLFEAVIDTFFPLFN